MSRIYYYYIPLDFIGLCEVHFCHVIRVGADLKLAGLGVQGKSVKSHGTNEVYVCCLTS